MRRRRDDRGGVRDKHMAKKPIEVTALKHDTAKRRNIPTAEFESVMRAEDKSPVQLAYARRNRDLDPQLVWRGKDEQDWSDLIVQAPPLYIQEKVHPKVIIDDLKRETKERAKEAPGAAVDLFADFNGLRDKEAATEFYQHDQHWSNRMISGDSLSVMASLAEREGLRGKVQCIFFDPPYGIKFNSNFQWSTTSRDVKDGSKEHITREPEQVRAFRDTWRDGIHSYLTYLRDRLTVAHDLLHESGSIFVQIGDENVHRVRALLEEVFGQDNMFGQISFVKAGALGASGLPRRLDYLIWFVKNPGRTKYRKFLIEKTPDDVGQYTSVVTDDFGLRPLTPEEKRSPQLIPLDRLCRLVSFTKPGPGARYPIRFEGGEFQPGTRWWGFPEPSAKQIVKAGRIRRQGNSIASLRYWNDYAVEELTNLWSDTASGSGMDKVYVVQTNNEVVKRCIIMTTDPGDLVLDPTCGSGTTAYVAEQWGRRWITIDTSRVSLALARSRLMGARYPYYFLADSPEGQRKEGEATRAVPKATPTHSDIRHGFVYERVPHITLKSIANNAEIDVIWEKWQTTLEPLRASLNAALGKAWEEWEVPREAGDPWPVKAVTAWEAVQVAKDRPEAVNVALRTLNQELKRGYVLATLPTAPRDPWPPTPTETHGKWWEARIARQKEIDGSIAAKAEFEYLYDKPYVDTSRVRVAGPFTVESLSPHRTLAVDWNDELIDVLEASEGKQAAPDRDEAVTEFAQMILENLKVAGVQQAHKEDRITLTCSGAQS